MATIEQCVFCFEALASHLESRKSMTLEQVQKSFSDYLKSLDNETSSETADAGPESQRLSKQLPALRRVAASSSSDSSSPSSASVSTTSLAPDTAATSMASLVAATIPEEYPLFVTWNIASARGGYNLRGCIGTFEHQPLEEGLRDYAITSAIHDTRFNPISERELSSLEVAITLLTDFEDAADAMDWEIGTHGLRISFYHHGRRYGSTYLPDVAPEQGWTKEETVVSLMRKAGWMGSRSKWRDVDLKVVRYQGKRESLEYGEYKRWRDWADKNTKA